MRMTFCSPYATVFAVALTVFLSERSRTSQCSVPARGAKPCSSAGPNHRRTIARIAPAGELGEALQWRGRTLDAKGTPMPGIIVYAYHTDATGLYPPDDSQPRGSAAYRHGRLRGLGAQRCRRTLRLQHDTASGLSLTQRSGAHPRARDRTRPLHLLHRRREIPRRSAARRCHAHTRRARWRWARRTRNARTASWTIARDIVLGKESAGLCRLRES